jgi:hypothetical protein
MRLDIERQNRLEPKRIEYAKKKLQEIGCVIEYEDNTKIIFLDKAKNRITFYPYSGWHTGKSIKDGRGLNNLLEQLKVEKGV